MFHWICPECGEECSPAIRDCPTCYPSGERSREAEPAPGAKPQMSLAVAATSVAELPPPEPPVGLREGAEQLARLPQAAENGLAQPLLNLADQLHVADTPDSVIAEAATVAPPEGKTGPADEAPAAEPAAVATEPSSAPESITVLPEPLVAECEPAAAIETPAAVAPEMESIAALAEPAPAEPEPAAAIETPAAVAGEMKSIAALDEPTPTDPEPAAAVETPAAVAREMESIAALDEPTPAEPEPAAAIEAPDAIAPAPEAIPALPEPTAANPELPLAAEAPAAEPDGDAVFATEPPFAPEAIAALPEPTPDAPAPELETTIQADETRAVLTASAHASATEPEGLCAEPASMPGEPSVLPHDTLAELAALAARPASMPAPFIEHRDYATDPEPVSAPPSVDIVAEPAPKALARPAEDAPNALVTVRPAQVMRTNSAVDTEADVVDVLGEEAPKQKNVPGWLVSLVAALVFLVVGVTMLFYVLPAGASKLPRTADPAAAPAAPAVVNAAALQHPLSRYLEVTGLRVNMNLHKKSSLQYIVVNHSDSEIAEATANVVVRSASGSPQQPPVCAFKVKIPSLGPFASREYSMPIDTQVRTMEMPEWQNLRADVDVTVP